MPVHPKPLALAMLSLLVSTHAMAQGGTAVDAGVPSLDDIVVTASRQAEPLRDTLGDISVITRKELAGAGAESLAQVLSRHHGIQIAASGGPQTQTSVFLRGANPNQTLVLIDGVRVNSTIQGGFNWQAMDPSIIERVEIVRGAASSLYGSDAIGGVINIITRHDGQDRPFAAWANIGVGSHSTFKTSAGFSAASKGWDYALSASLADSDGFNATNLNSMSYHPDRDGYSQHGFSGSLGYTWRHGHRIGVTAYNNYLRADEDSGLFVEPAYNIVRQQAYTLSSTDVITDYWTSTVRLGLTKEHPENRSWNSEYTSLQRNYLWQNDIQLAEGQRLSTVLERQEERATHSRGYDQDRRDTNSAGLVYRGDFGRHHVQANIRNDNITGYGNQTTGGLAYDLDITPRWKIGLSGNTGFRAPTFSDMYYPFEQYYWNGFPSGSFSGNPDLKPEKSRNIEARIQYQHEGTQLGAVMYQNRIRNLINGYVCDASFDCTAMNTDKAVIRGLTLTASQTMGDTTLRASADFMNPKDDETGNLLVRRAQQVYRLGAERRLDAFTLGAEYQFTGKRYDDLANERKLGGYGLLNLTAAYALNANATVQVRWDNVLDKNYANAYGYRTAGSSVFVNLALRM